MFVIVCFVAFRNILEDVVDDKLLIPVEMSGEAYDTIDLQDFAALERSHCCRCFLFSAPDLSFFLFHSLLMFYCLKYC